MMLVLKVWPGGEFCFPVNSKKFEFICKVGDTFNTILFMEILVLYSIVLSSGEVRLKFIVIRLCIFWNMCVLLCPFCSDEKNYSYFIWYKLHKTTVGLIEFSISCPIFCQAKKQIFYGGHLNHSTWCCVGNKLK